MKYVFVDMDGVIAEYGYPSGLYDGKFQTGNYLGKKPVNYIIDKILNNYGNQDYVIMICSASPNSFGVMEKNEWLDTFFKVPYENRIFISPEEDKVDVIKYYMEMIISKPVQDNVIIIDDKGSILAKARALGIECYHPTQLMTKLSIETTAEIAEAPTVTKETSKEE